MVAAYILIIILGGTMVYSSIKLEPLDHEGFWNKYAFLVLGIFIILAFTTFAIRDIYG